LDALATKRGSGFEHRARTECGAKQFPIGAEARAAPFALLK
jgi:hypothetical protein